MQLSPFGASFVEELSRFDTAKTRIGKIGRFGQLNLFADDFHLGFRKRALPVLCRRTCSIRSKKQSPKDTAGLIKRVGNRIRLDKRYYRLFEIFDKDRSSIRCFFFLLKRVNGVVPLRKMAVRLRSRP